MSQPIDVVRDRLPNPDLLKLEGIDETEEAIVLRVWSKKPPRCPACSSAEVSHHSTYIRHLRDLPWQGRPVRIQCKTRRFRCLNPQCPRKIPAIEPHERVTAERVLWLKRVCAFSPADPRSAVYSDFRASAGKRLLNPAYSCHYLSGSNEQTRRNDS